MTPNNPPPPEPGFALTMEPEHAPPPPLTDAERDALHWLDPVPDTHTSGLPVAPGGDVTPVNPGDWVRFQCHGKLVVGVAAYFRECEIYPYGREVITDIGAVMLSDVLEVRGPTP